jgi:hypothetical protein
MLRYYALAKRVNLRTGRVRRLVKVPAADLACSGFHRIFNGCASSVTIGPSSADSVGLTLSQGQSAVSKHAADLRGNPDAACEKGKGNQKCKSFHRKIMPIRSNGFWYNLCAVCFSSVVSAFSLFKITVISNHTNIPVFVKNACKMMNYL